MEWGGEEGSEGVRWVEVVEVKRERDEEYGGGEWGGVVGERGGERVMYSDERDV